MTMYPEQDRSRPIEIDYAGSRTTAAFFNTVYAWMSAGLALTAVVAWWVSTRPDLMRRYSAGRS